MSVTVKAFSASGQYIPSSNSQDDAPSFTDDAEVVDLMDILSSINAENAPSHFAVMTTVNILSQVALILQVAECTQVGINWVRENNMPMYSLKNLNRIFTKEGDHHNIEIETALTLACVILEDNGREYLKIAHLDTKELHAAMEFLTYIWLNVKDKNREEIKESARVILRLLRLRFEV